MLDIDKQYIMGYSVSDNGYIITETNENAPYYMKEMAMKNRIVTNILSLIMNPKNQINLTQPITTDRVKKLSEKSDLGLAARYMNGWDPSSKYRMQIENMVGKKVIGNVATAIKSFFALSNLYNSKFDEIYNLMVAGDFDNARWMLARYSFEHNGKRITLANVNLDKFIPLMNTDMPVDIKEFLLDLINFENALEDQSMVLGEVLNCATDFFTSENI